LGMLGLCMVLGMAILAIVGHIVAPSMPYWWSMRRDPVDAFLQVSADSFIYALAIAVISLAVGLTIGFLSVVIRRSRYPIAVFAESLVSIPLIVVLVGGYFALEYPMSRLWFALPIALIAWAPLAQSFMSRKSRGKTAKMNLVESARECLPDALSSLRFVVVIGTLSMFLFDYLLRHDSWGGMLRYAAGRGLIEGFNLWWVLPLAGIFVLLGGYCLVLTVASQELRKSSGQTRPDSAGPQ
jgi:hypothetical protein